jgi:aminoglycoside phosphotransferase family enzyme
MLEPKRAGQIQAATGSEKMSMESNASPADSAAPLDAKVAFLRRPESYPDQPARVETVETHMSWVFLTDRHAYKLKKPVRYEYLDFSTLHARQRDCKEEVRLNRRLAKDVYLGTEPLTMSRTGGFELGGSGEVVDWLVKMRRLPASRMLDQAIRESTVQESDIRNLALTLTSFYQRAHPISVSPSEYRRRFGRDIEANWRELSHSAYGLDTATADAVCIAQLRFIAAETVLFTRAVREGRIIEAHGDLRPEHVCLLPAPVVIDCLEFKRAFRIMYAADELAFLAMECERLGAMFVTDILFQTYCQATGDMPPDRLLNFYKSYRASLRAKLSIVHTKDPSVRDATKWRRRAQEYLQLAQTYIQGV